MLRALVLALIVANLAFWAWSEGAFSALGLAPTQERDPGRLALQVRPDAVRVLSAAAPAASRPATAPGRVAPQCLEAGPFAAAEIEAAERALAVLALPEGSWQRGSHEAAASLNYLRIEAASPAQAERLRALSDAALGAGFVPCANAAPAPAR
jgi:hypothetical protein